MIISSRLLRVEPDTALKSLMKPSSSLVICRICRELWTRRYFRILGLIVRNSARLLLVMLCLTANKTTINLSHWSQASTKLMSFWGMSNQTNITSNSSRTCISKTFWNSSTSKRARSTSTKWYRAILPAWLNLKTKKTWKWWQPPAIHQWRRYLWCLIILLSLVLMIKTTWFKAQSSTTRCSHSWKVRRFRTPKT